MNVKEFSEQFDILYNNIMSNKAPGLSEYEKSVFLTRAQEEIVVGLYNGQIKRDSFEETEELKRYLNSLITTVNFSVSDTTNTLNQLTGNDAYSPNSYSFKKPQNVLFVVYEEAILDTGNDCTPSTIAQVKPVIHENLYNFIRNPFQRPSKKRVLRVDKGKNNASTNVTIGTNEELCYLYSQYPITSYGMTFLRRPRPIILVDLGTADTIEGVSTPQTSELDSFIHKMILDLAVQMAKSIWQ